MTPPAGTLIAFSTDAGRVAFDGNGRNSLYTEELVKFLAMPGLTIEQVFKRTRADVMEKSGGAQIPAEYSRLVGDDIYLAGRDNAEPTPRAVAVEPPGPPAINKLAAAGQVALRYGSTNPNGSVADIAGVCNAAGNVLGLMPHPENFVVGRQHPHHHRGGFSITYDVTMTKEVE